MEGLKAVLDANVTRFALYPLLTQIWQSHNACIERLFSNSYHGCCIGEVWVHGHVKDSPGIFGFLYSARKEAQGERLHAILSWDEDISDIQPFIEKCQRLRMTNNCFKAGRHGTYLSFDTEVNILPNIFEKCDHGQ